MKKRFLIAGFGIFVFVLLSALLTRPAYAQTCSAQNIDPGGYTNVSYTIPSRPNEQLVLEVGFPTGGSQPNYCSEFGPTDGGGHASGRIGPFSDPGRYTIAVWPKSPLGNCNTLKTFPWTQPLCFNEFWVGEPQDEGIKYDICQGDKTGDCKPCVARGDAWTAIGCIHTSDTQEFTIWLLRTGIGIAGGIALLLMIMGGILIIVSSGDPQKLQSGKDILTSAIAGLIVIIFSVFLLQLIGVQILMIPGFK